MRWVTCRQTVSVAPLAAALILSAIATSQERKLARYAVGPKPLISMTSDHGAITVRSSGSNQIVVSAASDTDSTNFVAEQRGNRIELRAESSTHDKSSAEYIVLVPNDSTVSLRSLDGNLHVERLQGDVILETATAPVEAVAITGAHVHVKTLSGGVTLTDIRDSHLDIHSVSGNINIHNVSGAFVEVGSDSGRITYNGDPGSSGFYKLTSHTGDLVVTIPAAALADIRAHSLRRESDRPLSNGSTASPMNQSNLFSGSGVVANSRFVLRSLRGKILLRRP